MLPGNDPISTRDSDSKEDFLKQARERAAYAVTCWKHNFDAAQEDIRFLAGDQWPESVRKERDDEGRPCLTLNKLPQYLDQVIGDQRQNRPAIHVHPVEDDKTTMGKLPNIAGTADYSLSEVYESLIRNIEYTSKAESHYDRAFQHALEGGFGWLRVLTKYSREDTFDLDLCISAVHNRFAVLLDPDAKEPDYSDAEWGFIAELIPEKEYKKRYPGKAVGDLSDAERSDFSWWRDKEGVRVSEYFYREPANRTLLLLSDGRTVYEDEVKDVLDELERDFGVTVVRKRKVKTYKVKWRKITAYDILEGEEKGGIDWPGCTIPIVPVLGKDITLGDRTYYRGLIRFAKDAQRMHNYWMTAATERVALAPKAPFVGPAEAFEGYEQIWKTANSQNHAYLPYNAIPGVDRPQREMPPNMPAAELQLALSATDEMKQTVGLYDASVGAEGPEISGRAILARQRQGDRGTFTYIDNLSKSIARIGQILIELIPKIYDSERVLRLRFEDGEGDWVQINQTVIDEETGKEVLVHDISAGKYDVTVKSGPSYQTQRMEAADSLMQFVQAVPAAGAVISDLIAQNMDWPGAKEIAKRLKKITPPGILDEDEMAELGIDPPQPTPEQQATMAKAEADIATAQADTARAQADTVKAEADMAMAQAKTAEAQAKIAEIERAASIAGPDTIEDTVRTLVADALAELLAQTGS